MSIFTPDRSLYIQLWTISPSRSGHSCVKPANCMFNLLAPSKYRSFGRELSQILFSAYICPAFTHQILSSPLAVFPSQKSSDENGGPRGKDLGTPFAGRHCLFQGISELFSNGNRKTRQLPYRHAWAYCFSNVGSALSSSVTMKSFLLAAILYSHRRQNQLLTLIHLDQT